MLQFGVYAIERTSDGLGGTVNSEILTHVDFGYIDLLTGTSFNPNQNSRIEASTHVLIIPSIPENYDAIYQAQNIIIANNKKYQIDYVDNPVSVNHHLEVYLRSA